MKKLILLVVVLLFVFTLSACSPKYINIDNSKLREMLASDVDYYFIDVRTSTEFYEERIPGFTLNVDYYLLDLDHSIIDNLDRTRPVVIMCNSGNRSVSASNIFIDEGFDEVYNLTDGIQGWDGETE